MKRCLFIITIFSLLISTAGYSQTSASASFTASVTIVEPVGITTTSNMNFARIEAGKGGQVVLAPDNTRTAWGGVQLAEGQTGAAASFEVIGNDGFTFDLSLPQGSYVLSSGDQNIVVRDFQSDIEGTGNLIGGAQTVKVGATLEISANQTPGRYTNTDGFTVTVNYN